MTVLPAISPPRPVDLVNALFSPPFPVRLFLDRGNLSLKAVFSPPHSCPLRRIGFAFCDFQTKAMADECVRNMDGLKLENLEISVEIARR